MSKNDFESWGDEPGLAEPETKNHKKGLNTLLVFIGILVVIIVSLIWYTQVQKAQLTADTEKAIGRLEGKRDELLEQRTYYRDREKELQSVIQSQNEMIQVHQTEVNDLNNKIDSYQNAQGDFYAEIEKLQNEKTKLGITIDSLIEDNESLRYNQSSAISNEEKTQKEIYEVDDKKIYYQNQIDGLKGQIIKLNKQITLYEAKSGNSSNTFILSFQDKRKRQVLLDNVKVKASEIDGEIITLDVKINFVWLSLKESGGRNIKVFFLKEGEQVSKPEERTIALDGGLHFPIKINYFNNKNKRESRGKYTIQVKSEGKSILPYDFEFYVE